MQLETIAKKHQKDTIACFWSMLRELESTAENENSPVLKHQVGGWYRQWNAMTGDSKVPRFVNDLVVLTPQKQEEEPKLWVRRDTRRAQITECVKDAMASENLYHPQHWVTRFRDGSKMFRYYVGMQGYGTMARLIKTVTKNITDAGVDIESISLYREFNKVNCLGDIIEVKVGKLQD